MKLNLIEELSKTKLLTELYNQKYIINIYNRNNKKFITKQYKC